MIPAAYEGRRGDITFLSLKDIPAKMKKKYHFYAFLIVPEMSNSNTLCLKSSDEKLSLLLLSCNMLLS